jgi:hypothetical protein
VPTYSLYRGHFFVLRGDWKSKYDFAKRAALAKYVQGDGPSFGYVSIPKRWNFHPPIAGGAPMLERSKGDIVARVPLWLPLVALIGWLVFRELRWKERKTKTLGHEA